MTRGKKLPRYPFVFPIMNKHCIVVSVFVLCVSIESFYFITPEDVSPLSLETSTEVIKVGSEISRSFLWTITVQAPPFTATKDPSLDLVIVIDR